jgi:ParB-like chromosome segregation protein Spo0J
MTPPTPFPPYKTAPVAALIPYARNARTHSDAQVARIAASIREFGFTNPILVDGDRGVIAGHGRLLAARQLGLAEVPTIELAHLTPAQRRTYVLADNRLALDAGWDEAMLKIELGELQAEGFDLALTGFEPDEIGKLLIDAGDGLTVGRTGRLRADRHRRLRRANRARGAVALRAAGARPGAALRHARASGGSAGV